MNLWGMVIPKFLIKSLKRTTEIIVGEQTLSFSALQTVCFQAGGLFSGRPIGRHPTNPEKGAYLSQNYLLLGRASSGNPTGPFKEPISLRKRFCLVQQIVNGFWCQ